MASYAFLTSEGVTFQPNSESEVPDLENLQVLGFADGDTSDDAYRSLLDGASYLLKTTFDEIVCYELVKDYERTRRDLSVKETLRNLRSGA